MRLIDSCITQLNAQGPSRTCNESKEEPLTPERATQDEEGVTEEEKKMIQDIGKDRDRQRREIRRAQVC